MVKPVIIKRNVKGAALTFSELDTNFQNLDDATISIAVQGGDTVVNDLNDTTTFVATDGIAITATASSQSIAFDASVIQDTTPQLGGNLDVNGHSIVSTSNGDITLDPNGTGKVIIAGDLQVDGTTTTINSTTLDVDDINITLGKGSPNASASNGGGITLEGPTTSATLLYANTDDSWNFNKKTTAPELQIDNINVNGNSIISSDTNGNIVITPNGTGSIVLDGLSWPQADGQDRAVLTTDGAGQLSLEPVDNLRIFVTNAESTTINKGQPVYAYSSDGNRVSVKLAYNTSDATSAQTLGLAATNISAGGQGYVISQGLLKNADTSSYSAGQQLYLGSTAGTLTSTKPYAPNHLVYVAVVEIGGSVSAGRLFVRVQNGYELDEIHDVDINHTNALANGDLLQYNSSTQTWRNKAVSTIVTPAGSNQQIQFNNSGAFGASSGLTYDGVSIKVNGNLESVYQSGDEGGEIYLNKPATNTSITNGVTIDVYQNKLRIFENGGTNRGGYFDITGLTAGVGTNFTNYVDLTSTQTITGSKNITGLTTLKQYIETVYAGGNTGTGTYTPTLSNGAVQTITATGNFTLAAPSGMSTGSSITLIIRQDGTGSRTWTLNSAYKVLGGATTANKTLSTTALSIDVFTIFYDGTNYLCNLGKGYA